MPFVKNKGVKIHYEVEGQGPPMVLVHGLTSSLESWRIYGYVSELKKHYQVIMLDVRGHGQSDKPDDLNAYDMRTLAEDVIAVLNELKINKAHYLGYSLGALIGFWGIAGYYLSRFNSLILGGFSAYLDGPYLRYRQGLKELRQSALEKGMSVVAEAFEQARGGKLPTAELNSLLSMNPRIFFNILTRVDDSFSKGNADQILSRINIPCLTFAGDACPSFTGLKNTTHKILKASFIPLQDANHFSVMMRSDLLLPCVMDFLEKVSRD